MTSAHHIIVDQTDTWLEQHASANTDSVDWLKKYRQTALKQFAEQGLPSIKDEDWRYTSLRKLKGKTLSLVTESAESLNSDLLAPTEHPRLVFVNGQLDKTNSDQELNEHCWLLQDFVQQHAEKCESVLGRTLPDAQQQHAFQLLNSAFASQGYVIYLPKNAQLNTVEIVFVSTNHESAQHVRNLIIAEQHTKCSIIERHIGIGDTQYLQNSITEIVANDNAHISHYKLIEEAENAVHFGGVFVEQAANSQVKSFNVSLSGELVRNDLLSNLIGSGAYSEMNGLVMGNNSSHIDNHTQVIHAVPHCRSDEFYKSILDDKSRSVFRGRIVVAQDAQQTNADQQNNNLLLSKLAEADTKPQLEIYADDVQCSHGATVGQLEPKSLFYLQSRGINQDSAMKLLTFAFANEVIDRFDIESIRTELTQRIAGDILDELAV